MNVVAELGVLFDSVDDVFCKIARVRGGEANTLNAVNLADVDEQFGKGSLSAGVAVAVHVLAEELNLGVAKASDALSFGQHRGRRARALLAPRIRNNAVGAELVATLDDGDVAAVGIRARGEFGVEGLVRLAVVEPGHARLAG